VVYSAAIDDHADSFNPIEDYWEKSHQSDLKCSILFISKSSVYIQQHSSDRKVGNWHIVTVGNLTGGFSDGRKASRVPKLSPGKFFADTVEYALYVDAKLLLLKHPEDLLSTYVYRANKTSLALMGEFRTTSTTFTTNCKSSTTSDFTVGRVSRTTLRC
jgi:hypothetical protein